MGNAGHQAQFISCCRHIESVADLKLIRQVDDEDELLTVPATILFAMLAGKRFPKAVIDSADQWRFTARSMLTSFRSCSIRKIVCLLTYSAKRARLTILVPRPPREFRFRLPSEARGRFRTVTPERCCAALSWRIVSKRLSSSSQRSLRLKSFSQSPAKFKRIGRSRSAVAKNQRFGLPAPVPSLVATGTRASSSAQWLKTAGSELSCVPRHN